MDHSEAKTHRKGRLSQVSERRQQDNSQLFLIRLQAEEVDAGHLEWCGKIQRVVSGETYSFCGWPELVEHLLTMLPSLPERDSKDPMLFGPDEKSRSATAPQLRRVVRQATSRS